MIDELEFGSFLTYSPRAKSKDAIISQNIMYRLKSDQPVGKSNPILMSHRLSILLRKYIDNSILHNFFDNDPILVPVPTSSLSQSNTLWVPQCLANRLIDVGLGTSVESCLTRNETIRKFSSSLSKNRPKITDHYDSITVKKILHEPKEIILIDDVITRGVTLLGTASKLADVFPNTNIKGFAFIRTMLPQNFNDIIDPYIAKIVLDDDGESTKYKTI